MAPLISTYLWPGQVHFGFGAAGYLGREAQALHARHAYLITDPGVVAAGLLQPLIIALDSAGVAHSLYDQVVANPEGASVEAAAQAFLASGADLVVGVGGGSALDTAKAVRLLAGGGGRIAEYDLLLGDKVRPAPSQMPPMLAVPTTAGTGSEVTAWAVVTDPARKFKTSVGGPWLLPTAALIDPELMLGLPPFLTAATGMDALSHCIESYVSTTDHPLVDQMALYGIELIGRSLPTAVAQGSNREARREMALAAMIGGMALNCKWGGACHSVAHQLSTFAGVHHGLANALMLPPQMAYSQLGSLEKYSRIGAALGTPKTGTLRQQAQAAVDSVRQLSADLGLPQRLRDVGVTPELIPAMARNAYLDDSWATNPRAVTEAVLAEWYHQAL